MSRVAQDAGDALWSEGQAISLVFTRTSPTTATISWNSPAVISPDSTSTSYSSTDAAGTTTVVVTSPVTTNLPVAYNGILITASMLDLVPVNRWNACLKKNNYFYCTD